MEPLELINTGRRLAGGQPTEEDLRRAISTAYYAMFHALAASNADLTDGPMTQANRDKWTGTYRSLRHARASDMLGRWPHLCAPAIRDCQGQPKTVPLGQSKNVPPSSEGRAKVCHPQALNTV
ncbi:MAG: hypothetical protein OXN21_00135 [Chloroflexota bacterium]|nr:hypothetical protein [Chloroflexota bacterium]